MSLRAWFGAVAGAFLLFVVASGAGGIIFTAVLAARVDAAADSVAGLHAAQALQSSLLIHNRAAFRAALTGEERYRERRLAAEKDLTVWMESPAIRNDETERQLLERLSQNLRRYLREHQEVDAQLLERISGTVERYLQVEDQIEATGADALKAYERLDPLLENAHAAAEQLVQYELQNARDAREKTRALSRSLSSVSLLSALTIPAALVLLLLIVRRRVYLPLETVASTLQAYSAGEKDQRAAETGPAEVARIASCFNVMADRLAQQRRRQEEFLAAVVHDLRNPLSALVLTTSRPAKEGSDEPSSDAVLRRRMALVTRQVGLLRRMLDDLLEVWTTEAGDLQLRRESCDLRAIARASAELFEGTSDKHSIIVAVPEHPIVVDADAMRLEQVVNNLISNAIKYSPKGCQVQVALRTELRQAVLSVSDRGMGISEAHQKELFIPFRRLASTRDQVPGVGLGLSVSRRFVEAHGGRIEVESVVGEGSTFRLFLPLHPDGEPAHRT